jgi:neutral ceramidase
MSTLRVGFGQCDITPPLGLPLGGYGARVAPADGILDRLFCRAAIFDEGTAPTALVVLDLVHVLGSWVARLRARAAQLFGLRPERLLVAATHTHAGPGVFRSVIGDRTRVTAYEDSLLIEVTNCVGAALRNAVPALLSYGRAHASGVAANRRDPALPIDDTVRVLCAHAASGQLLGVLANFACHSTVLSAANCSYSGDLFGSAAAKAARQLAAPVLLTNGAGADVSTRFTRRDQSYAEVQRLGGTLAKAIHTAVRAAVDCGLVDQAGFGAALQAVDVRWRDLPAPDDAMVEFQAAEDTLRSLRAQGTDPARLRLAESRVEGAQAMLWVTSLGGWEAVFGPRPAVAELQAMWCAGVPILAAPGEVFSCAGKWVRGQLGESASIIGYANDYLGYFIPETEVSAGGYESLIAAIEPSCEADLRRGLVEVAQRATPRSQIGAEAR